MSNRICKICGKEYIAEYPNSKYCSILCKEMGNKINHKAWSDKNKDYNTIYMREYRKRIPKEANNL